MGGKGEGYDKRYYQSNRQTDDRIALRFYRRLAASFVKSGRVLDYGCGTGHLIKRFTKGYEAWAYDVSPYALESVRHTAPYARVCSSAESLARSTFDLVISLHVLEHIESPMQTLEFFRELLGKEGILIYAVPNMSGLGHTLKKQRWSAYGDASHVSLLAAREWLTLTEAAGFRIVKSGTDGLWDVPYIRYVPLWLQRIIFYPLPAIQVGTGRLILPSAWGESLIVVARKNS